MSKQIQTLLQRLIDAAKAQGLSQAQLAELAGLSAVGLSKAKTRGDIRASTLAELASQLNLDLALVPRQSPQQAAQAIKSGAFFHTGGKSQGKDE
jgi:transcriptional regulator with XRE-family HTH domain